MFADDIILVFEQSVREIVASDLCNLDIRIGDRTTFFNSPDNSDNGGFTISQFVDHRRNPEADGKCRNNADDADDGSVTKGMRADGFFILSHNPVLSVFLIRSEMPQMLRPPETESAQRGLCGI